MVSTRQTAVNMATYRSSGGPAPIIYSMPRRITPGNSTFGLVTIRLPSSLIPVCSPLLAVHVDGALGTAEESPELAALVAQPASGGPWDQLRKFPGTSSYQRGIDHPGRHLKDLST